jgi:heptosyltransferase III
MKAPKRVLVIVTRRIGDVLLATPLIRTVREAWPKTSIDVLVFKNTEGVIVNNSDIEEIFTIEENSSIGANIKLILKIFRRYDICFSTLAGDRQVFYSWLAGRYSIGLVPDNGINHFWKRCLLSKWAYLDNLNTHTVLMNLKLAQLLTLDLHYDVIVSWQKTDEYHVAALLPFNMKSEPFAVIHMYPKYPYKEWSREGWIKLVLWLNAKGINIVFTGSDEVNETNGISQFLNSLPIAAINMIGKFSLSEIGFLLSCATVYVGPDTVITHMAAAQGIPTIALYGPTNPVKWGPWPKGHNVAQNPFVRQGSQRVKNVFLVQEEGQCVPCHEEGCGRSIESLSECLQNLSADKVITAVKQALG